MERLRRYVLYGVGALLVLAACGPDLEVRFSCTNLPIFHDVQFAYFADCARVARDIEVVRSRLLTGGTCEDGTVVPPLMTEAELAGYRDAWVYVYATDTFMGSYGRRLVGEYQFNNGLVLARDGRALNHEMFHMLDGSRCDFTSASHWRWEEKGYFPFDRLVCPHLEGFADRGAAEFPACF